MKKIFFVLLLILSANAKLFADVINIDHFIVKENPFAEREVAIVAVDSLENIREDVDGLFSFTINGFEEQMRFEKGTAFYHRKLDKSSFFYVKHINDNGTHAMLYYIYKQDGGLKPIKVSWALLLGIPLGLVLLGYLFKRFIAIILIVFCIFLFFNYQNGLSISTFLESIVNGLKGVFGG
ncbi:hypothetical protein [Mucilaginibacter auburnensis]|uniref:Uncharacterized protein n=1 Tax=Mucilaginibacter auburnensis TaxID=1457233 RepID=A0A2H9VMT2_9SPHI|nr:hypothetical protein [Mucilaginibacter auburnensis]PJJ79631.1 hypothetical protein CLV57_2766 [Mucilaginibacter auburnensis]